jgi:glucose dehydrogenase/plastocyanin
MRPGIWANRGVAVGDGMVFSGTVDGSVVALDQQAGTPVWRVALAAEEAGPQTARNVTNALLYYNGMVVTGQSVGDLGFRGRLYALDSKTGNEIWRFYTVPAPGEPGSDSWPADSDAWRHGGGSVWNLPVVDPDLGLIYFQVGNPYPDYDGSVRAGNNLYTDSVVAVDAKTGQYRWHYQTVHHDIWDFDASNAPILFDTVVDGQPRKAIAQSAKPGWLYLLDRTNGQSLLGIDERPVRQEPRQRTSATQPFPVGDAVVPQCPVNPVPGFLTSCVFAPFWDVPVLTGPGPYGGNDYAPISYDPQTGYFYLGGSVLNFAYGLRQETVGATGAPVVQRGTGAYIPIGTERRGTLTAIDSRTNQIVWQEDRPFPVGLGSGTMTTAGGLLFHGEPDGNVQAYDARTGDLLWQWQTGFGADGPPVTYEVDGVQYVAIATGGNRLINSARGDAVWAFTLNGQLQPAEAPAPPPAVQSFTTQPIDTNSVSIGRQWDVALNTLGVKIEYGYGPDRIHVAAGTTVTWTNDGDLQHTATSRDGVFDTGLLASGATASHTFDTPGVYDYFCAPHPWMVGEVIVDPPTQN